jgi:hypothetical protein
VIDANGQSLAYFYARENDHDANTAGVLTMDEARRMASNFAKLPELVGRRSCSDRRNECLQTTFSSRALVASAREKTSMKTLISIFALTLALAFTVPLLLETTPRQKRPRSNARRMAAIGMIRTRRAQENIEVPIAAGR